MGSVAEISPNVEVPVPISVQTKLLANDDDTRRWH